MDKQIDIIIDLLTDFDEMGFAPTTSCPDPDAYAIDWRNKLTNALQDYRKQSEVDLREEITTDDFGDLELAKERGWHRKKFYCPNCDLLIKIETWDSERMFGSGTILKSNEMPKFCPECGAKMKGGAE